MEASKPSSDDINFRPPDEPGPFFRVPENISRMHSGKRRGSGRKRKHDERYENIRSSIWRTISMHKDVYDEWIHMREQHNFKDNTTFARFLLQRAQNDPCRDDVSNVTEQLELLGGIDERERYLISFF